MTETPRTSTDPDADRLNTKAEVPAEPSVPSTVPEPNEPSDPVAPQPPNSDPEPATPHPEPADPGKHDPSTDPPGAVSNQNGEEAQSGLREDGTHPEPRTAGKS